MNISQSPLPRNTSSSPPQTHYDPDTGSWDGQLVDSDLVAQVSADGPLPDRKTGGPLDRLTWLLTAASLVSDSAFKLLAVYVGHSDRNGFCWPSHQTLAKETGHAPRHIRRLNDELLQDGWIIVETSGKYQGRPNKIRLTGGLSEWGVGHPRPTPVGHPRPTG